MKLSDQILRMMGALIAHDIDPEVVRLFKAGSLEDLVETATQAHNARTFSGPQTGQLLGRHEWAPISVLPTFVAEVIRRVPDSDARSHLCGGICAMNVAPFWTEDRRLVIAKIADMAVRFTRSTEKYEEAGDSARYVLGAYDQALAMVAADARSHESAAEDEGQ